MSLNSLTNLEMSRSKSVAAGGAFLAAPLMVEENPVNNAINVLTKYIPTETITLYVAAVAATPALESLFGGFLTGKAIYWFFAALTPLLLILVLMSKRAAASQSPLLPRWPWWKMVAATIGFLIWALAVPGNPYITTDLAAVAAAFGAVFISTFLSLLDPIFDRPKPPE